MKQLVFFSLVALAGWTGAASADPTCEAGKCSSGHCSGCKSGCKEIPPADCPDCKEVCCHHGKCSAHAQKMLDKLCTGCCHERISAARKLGHRLVGGHLDCEVISGLVKALLCDSCWEVRQAAAGSLALQGAATRYALTALYISSRLDHHYLVREVALESLDRLTLCRKACYKEVFKSTDELIAQLRKDKVRPGKDGCDALLGSLEAVGGQAGIGGPAGEIIISETPAGTGGGFVPPLPSTQEPPVKPLERLDGK